MDSNGRFTLPKLPPKPILIGLGAALLIVIGWRMTHPSSKEPAMKPFAVERRNLKVTRVATGEVKPRNRVEIKPPIAGRIEEVLVKEGDPVTQGQVLVWMSSSDRAAMLDAARSKGPEEVARWAQIYQPAPLISPLNGTLIVRAVEPGQTVTTNDAVVVVSDQLIIKVQVDETDVGYIKADQRAEITLDAYPREVIPGQVEHVAYEAQTVNNVTIYQVDVRPDQVPDFMRSGMTANVNIIVSEAPNALTVPVDAIHREQGTRTVLLAPKNAFSQPKPQPVETGASDGKWVEVTSGLSEGDRVMIAPLRLPSGNRGGTNPLSPFRRPQQRPSNRQ